MKKTWVVYVGMSAGHEYSGMIQFSRWFGPYTREAALSLAVKLNARLDDGETEHQEATAMPLESMTSRKVLDMAKEGDIACE